ncbi:type II secretion system protein GspN [Geobacter sp. DSM 9736]|uniref:type II secretion system protein GspN n=1 Tax=Geobacter sp. DSM 9736 TaxID=1277350 RepID=UPI000B4FD72B|nr:type II secretion system protein GspN [Geobacter sp. DSM 9736]SNB47411.1 type II secretion system protein N [Geobacter sp. DSM 9736]
MRQRLLIVAAVAAALLLLLMLTVAFIPNEALRGVLSRGLESRGFLLQSGKVTKAFPLGIRVRNLTIGNDQGALIKADDAAVRLHVLPLLIGRVRVGLDARIGGGGVIGSYTATGGGSIVLTARAVRLEDIPFFSTKASAQVKGDLRGHAEIRKLRSTPGGDIQVEAKAVELAGVKIGVMPLPDAAYSLAQIKLRVTGGRILLQSATMQGEGLYVRLKGDVPLVASLPSAPLNLILELMPKPEFMERQKFVFLLLAKYLDTPGHYQIPIRGTLSHPSVF